MGILKKWKVAILKAGIVRFDSKKDSMKARKGRHPRRLAIGNLFFFEGFPKLRK